MNAGPQGRGSAFVAAGAIVLAAGVALGAVGAHAAKSAPHPEAARLIQTAVEYQLVHGLGLVVAGALARSGEASRLLALSGWLLLAGVAAFCGALYALAFAGVSTGALAPAGGISLIAGWIALAAFAIVGRRRKG